MNSISTAVNVINGTYTLVSNASKIINEIPKIIIDNENTISINSNIDNNLTYSREKLKLYLEKYPEKVPIILLKNKKSNLKSLPKNKFLINGDVLVAEFKYIIQKQLGLKSHQALFLFNNFYLVNNTITIRQLYNEKKEDDILYLTYCEENAFG